MNCNFITKQQARQLVDLSHLTSSQLELAGQLLATSELAQLQDKRIAIYISWRQELDTLPLIKKLLANNNQIFVPYITDYQQGSMIFQQLSQLDNLTANRWGIRELDQTKIPPQELNPQLDLIILPATAIDSNGNRLGKGGGFYDRYLANYLTSYQQLPELIAVVYQEQYLGAEQQTFLYTEKHDIPVNKGVLVNLEQSTVSLMLFG